METIVIRMNTGVYAEFVPGAESDWGRQFGATGELRLPSGNTRDAALSPKGTYLRIIVDESEGGGAVWEGVPCRIVETVYQGGP